VPFFRRISLREKKCHFSQKKSRKTRSTQHLTSRNCVISFGPLDLGTSWRWRWQYDCR
jgi:hypothetical protein